MANHKPGIVYLVGAGPGDPRLLTLRGAELLGRAEVVVHDAILNTTLLAHVDSTAEIIALNKRGMDRPTSQEDVNHLLVEKAREGRLVVRLKGGDPYVFGRGGEEAEALAEAGVRFEVVPGVSSFSAVPGAAGIPLTHRGHASAFMVVTGHEDPEKQDTAIDWRQVAQSHGTKVILMGVERLPGIADALVRGGLAETTPIALIRWGTTPMQRTVTGTLADIAHRVKEAGFTAPAVAVIGEVVKLRDKLNWFEARPLFGRRIVVTRSREQSAELSGRLSDLGAEVVLIPAIRVGPPTERQSMIEALAGLGEYDWVVFTSVNGVSAFFEALLIAYQDIRALGNLRVAAVGSVTAERLHHYRIRADAMPSEFLSQGIADAIAKHESLDNLRILLARAQVANPDLCRELESRGAIVDDIAFYRTEPELSDPGGFGALVQETGADWITFTSGSCVEHFNSRFNLSALVARHPGIRLASIGPETTNALGSLGLQPAVEAKPHTAEGIVQSIASAALASAAAPATLRP